MNRREVRAELRRWAAERPAPARAVFVDDLADRLRTVPSARAEAPARRRAAPALALAIGAVVALLGLGSVLVHRDDRARPLHVAGDAGDPVPDPSLLLPGAPSLPTTTASEPRPSTTTTSGPTSTSSPRAAVLHLEAKCSAQANGLAWTRYDGPDFGGYLVLRAARPTPPEYPPTDRSTEPVGATRDVDQTQWVDRRPQRRSGTPDEGSDYLVVAVDRDGRELARSNVAGCEAPGPAQSPPVTS